MFEHRSPRHRVPQIRCQFCYGPKYKAVFQHVLAGHVDWRLIQYKVIVEEQIDIELT